MIFLFAWTIQLKFIPILYGKHDDRQFLIILFYIWLVNNDDRPENYSVATRSAFNLNVNWNWWKWNERKKLIIWSIFSRIYSQVNSTTDSFFYRFIYFFINSFSLCSILPAWKPFLNAMNCNYAILGHFKYNF